jgi:hypothetical protein
MSAGHPHVRGNKQTKAELDEITKTDDFKRLWQRWKSFDVTHDIHDLAGYNVDGTIRYLDKDFFHALFDPEVAKKLGIGAIDTGLSPMDTIACLMQHEGIEKTAIDADNKFDTYDPAHGLATIAEHQEVRAKGGTPAKYERGLAAAIKFCESKELKNPPKDLACAPMLDDPDEEHDKAALKTLQDSGVEDAFKASRHSVDYSKSDGEDRCSRCKYWLADDRTQELSPCHEVEGLVRTDRWCKDFESVPAEKIAKQNEDLKTTVSTMAGQIEKLTAGMSDLEKRLSQAIAKGPKSRKRKKTVTTRRDDKGQLVADVVEEDEPDAPEIEPQEARQ